MTSRADEANTDVGKERLIESDSESSWTFFCSNTCFVDLSL